MVPESQMSTTAVRSPTEYEDQLQRYLFERSEEGRAVRVGEKEVSEQAAIVARYADRDELGELHADASATFNEARLELVRSAEELEAELSGEPDPVARSEEEKAISLRELEAALVDAAEQTSTQFVALRERWFDRLLGPERDE